MQIQNLLTFKQQRVLSTLRDYMYTQNQSPTLEQLRSALGFNSLRTVTQYLDILERKGYIVRRKNASRNIELGNGVGAWGHVRKPGSANVG